MRKLIFGLLLLVSTTVIAADYMVFQCTDEVRIVLGQTPGKCKSGNQASAQNINGSYIPGCWSYEPNPNLVRIVWYNGDFSVLRLKDFIPVKE